MCLSPHKMSTQQLERQIAALHEWAANPRYASAAEGFRARAGQLEKILKERAEEGTY